MRTLDASGLLDAWESGYSLSPPRRSLALLAHAHPHASRDELSTLPLGHCDLLLRQFRIALFGNELTFVATCPACASVVESTIDLANSAPATPVQSQRVRIDQHSISLRPPTLGDLIGLPGDPAAARQVLARRCIEAAEVDGELDPASMPLSDESLAAIGRAMSAADPAALSEIALACPDCDARWHSGLDMASFLWREIDAWARRTLREVHALARAYAWSERDVLALSPTRRQLYLELSRA